MDIKIPVYRPWLAGNEKKYVNECLDSTWISSKGKFIPLFEQKLAEYLGVRHAASVCNGTVALHAALLALGVGPGDEVIVPTLTYIASVNTIAYTGASPVFVDSLPDTWQMDPADVQKKITS
jgi:perosamine synthetase